MRRVDLGWMRVFVAVGRAGSLSEAAGRLHITQPAVSYQIRRAEAEFGVRLLSRHARGVALTPEGRALFEVLSRAVGEVDALAEDWRPGRRREGLRLFTDYAFSSLWLMPRLHRFRAACPGVDLQVVAVQRPTRPGRGDLAVVFGARPDLGGDPGADAVQIIPEVVVPVCAPSLCAPDAPAPPRIHLDAGPGAGWFDWPAYLRAQDVAEDPAPRGDLRFNTYALVIEAALAGQGVALGWRGLIDRLIAQGQLREAGAELANPERGYFLLGEPPHAPAAAALWAWLLAELTPDSGRAE